jgi:4-amino-4-deoxy-L-arabinose transferase-like glycosyltransferase
VADLVLLALVGGVVALLTWPALLAEPTDTLARVIQFGESEAGEPHPFDTFFLGQVQESPGPLFYPLILAYRLSPLVVLGLIVGLAVWARQGARRPSGPTVWVLGCALVVLLAMTVSAKKQERYILPAMPLLAVAAADRYRQVLPLLGRRWRPLVPAAVGLVQLGLCASVQPYFLAAYSPLLGGGTAAQAAIPVGWGEGLEPVSQWLAQQPPSERPTGGSDLVVAVPPSILRPAELQLPGTVVSTRDIDRDTLYLLTYVNADQRRISPSGPPEDLLLTVRIMGIDYARLYALGDDSITGAPPCDDEAAGCAPAGEKPVDAP